MSSGPLNCCSPCPPTVSVPGPEGVPGTNGTNGLNGGNAFTTTAQIINYVTPGSTAGNISFITTAFMAIGQYLYISDGGGNVGIFQVTSITSSTTATLTYIVDPINTASVGAIASRAAVTPSGFNGKNGAPGNNGFSFVATGGFQTPALGSSVTIPVDDSNWMQVGTYVTVGDGTGGLNGIYYVSGVTSGVPGSFTGYYYAFTVNTHAGAVIPAGGVVAPSFPGIVAPVVLYGTGTAYTTTNAQATITFGTSGAMTITLPQAGTWLLTTRARFDFVGGTVSSTTTLTTKMVSSSAGSLTPNSGYILPGVSTVSSTLTVLELPQIIYTTANYNDTISASTGTSIALAAGNLNVVECSIIATFLHP